MSEHTLLVGYDDGPAYSMECDNVTPAECGIVNHPAFLEMADELGLRPGRYPVRLVVGDGPDEIWLEVVGG